MTTPAVLVGPLTPYVTPQILINAPTGISWNTIPPGSNVSQETRTAEQWNIAQRASTMADGYCNQVLRATLETERVQGPDYYATYQQATGNIRIILSQWPVLSVTAIQVSANTFPRSWTSLPSGYWDVETPAMGVYNATQPTAAGQGGQSIIFSGQAGGGWCLGRSGFVFQVQYVAGWPHTSLTSAVEAGATSIDVDDCTGWAVADEAGTVGATGNVYDTGLQEVVQVTAASETAGPGTLTLASALNYNHASGVMVSTMPASIQWATILFATSIALVRGATATTAHSIPSGAPNSPGGKGPDALAEEAELLLHPFRRVI